MPPQEVYDNLEKAETTIIMLRDSCKAIKIAKDSGVNGFDLGEGWFEGAEFLCRDAVGAITEALDYLKPEEVPKTEDAETTEG